MAQIDPARLQQELDEMQRMINSDPDVLAHFDADGNGRIDGDEWNVVVDMVRQRLQREADEMAQYRETNARSEPADPSEGPSAESAGAVATQLFNEEVEPYVLNHRDPPALGLPEDALERWDELVLVRDEEGFGLYTRSEQQLGRITHRGAALCLEDTVAGRELVINVENKRLSIRAAETAALAWARWDSGIVRDRVHLGWGAVSTTATEGLLNGPFKLQLEGKLIAKFEQDYSGMDSIFRNRMDTVFVRATGLPPGPSRWALVLGALLIETHNHPDEQRETSVFDILFDLVFDD